MTPQHRRGNYPTFIPSIIAILFLSASFSAVAQTTGAGQTSAKHVVVSAQLSSATQGPPPVHFANAVPYNTGGFIAGSVAVADVNGDGKPDLVVANQCQHGPNACIAGLGGGVLSVMLGNGDGTFQPGTTYDSGGISANALAVADVNGDGKPDLIVANGTDKSGNGNGVVAVLLGKGDGTFQAAVIYDSGGYNAISLAIADVNGDGKLDVIVANEGFINYPNGAIAMLLGNGDGTFQPAVNYSSSGSAAVSVAVGDLNGDGQLDLVVANQGSSSVTVLLGNGDGTFQAPVSYSSGGEYPQSVAIGDVNSDGHPDVVVANGCGIGTCPNGVVTVLLGSGDGTFKFVSSSSPVRRYTFWVAIGDVNGDGKPDLAVASGCPPSSYFDTCNYPGEVAVLRGNGDGTFQPPISYYPGGWYPLSVAIADVNGDSKPDLLVTDICGFDTCASSVGVLLNDFTAITTIKVTSSLNPVFVHQSVTFSASITSNPPIPSGQIVTFYSDTTAIGTGSINSGTATITTSFPLRGYPTVRAKYLGDLYHKAGSGLLTETVDREPTSTTFTPSLNPSIYGETVAFTATVAGTHGVTLTGYVAFTWEGIHTIGSAKLSSSGVATLTKSNLNAGSYPLTAVYQGDATNAPSTSAILNQVVQETTSAAAITSSLNPSKAGQTVTFTAAITSPTVVPTGPVTFMAGTTVLGTAQLSGGKARFTTSSLPTGTTAIGVTYNGDSNIAKSSASVSQVVQP